MPSSGARSFLALLEGPTFPEVSTEVLVFPPTFPPNSSRCCLTLKPSLRSPSKAPREAELRRPGREAPALRLHCGFDLCPQPGPLPGTWRPSPIPCSLADKGAAHAVRATQRPRRRGAARGSDSRRRSPPRGSRDQDRGPVRKAENWRRGSFACGRQSI